MITLANLKIDLGITGTAEDAKLTRLIDRATGIIQRYCNRYFLLEDESGFSYLEEYRGSGTQYLNIKEYPIVNLIKVEVNESSAANPRWIDITSSIYTKDETGQIYLHSGFFKTENRYRVEYIGGYEEAPSDLEGACSDLVAYMFSNQGKQGLTGERIGDYSYTKGSITDIVAQSGVKEVLDAYRVPNA